MSRRPYDRDERQREDRAREKEAKLFEQQMRADVQQIMKLDAGRRVIGEFFAQMGLDHSSFSPNAMQQSHAIGKQDAAKWWVNLIRAYCPEKEAIIRAEFHKKPPAAPADEDEHEHE